MTNFTQPEALRLGKQAIVFPSPAAASVAVQLAQLVGVAESHGLKKSSSAFFADLLFWFVLDLNLESWGAGSKFCDRTTTPLIRAECQHLVLKCLCPYSLKGYSHFYMTAVLTAVLTAVFYLSALFA